MRMDQSHLCWGQALTSRLETGSKTTFCRNQMSSPKPHPAPKITQRTVQSGRKELESESCMKVPAGQKSMTWLQKSVRTMVIMRGRLVKKCSRQGLAMLKATIVTTQMLLMKRKMTLVSRPSVNIPCESYVAFATSIPPFAQQQSELYAWKMAMIEICPATWIPKAKTIWRRLVRLKRELRGRSMLRRGAVRVQPMKRMKKKLRQRSQQRYCRSPGYCRYFSLITVVVYSISEQIARMLNSEKLVARPARHSLISYTIELMFATWDVNGAEIEASAWERERPMSACFSAPQSLAPSPHMETRLSMCWKAMTILALSLGLVRANTVATFMNSFCRSVRSASTPEKISLKARPVTQSWELRLCAFRMICSMNSLASEDWMGVVRASLEPPFSISSSILSPRLGTWLLLTTASGVAGGCCLVAVASSSSSSSSKSKLSSTNRPSTQSQIIIPLLLSEISHLQLMFDPVSVLSPVIITQLISAAFSVAMAPLVSGFNLFSKTSKPLKRRPRSASSREMVWTAASLMVLLAMLRTLKPLEAKCLRVSLQLAGMVSFCMMVAIISGEPLAQTSAALVSPLRQTTLMRWRSESNSKRRQTRPWCLRALSKPKMTLGSEWDWLRLKRPNSKTLISMGSPTMESSRTTFVMELLAAMLVRMVLKKACLSALSSMRLMFCSLLMMVGQNLALSAGTRAQKSMKSSVSVPVLSKQQNSIMPPTITLFCAMQKIPLASSRSTAQMIPKVMLTGSAGGTVIVMRSKNFCTRSSTLAQLWMRMTRMMQVVTERRKRKKRYLQDSFWNTFSCSFGNRMMRISCPFVVTKLVRTTHTGIPYFSRKDSNLAMRFWSLTWMIVVPSQTKALLSMERVTLAMRSKESAFLTMGTDSPVRAHSLMRALPSRMMPSKGILMGSLRKTMSPGTTLMDWVGSMRPSRSTLTTTSQQAMLKILLLRAIIWMRLTVRPKEEMKNSTPAKQKYFSSQVQQEILKMRKRQSGRRIYLMVRSTQLGRSMTIVPGPQLFLSSCAWQSLSPRSSFLDITMCPMRSRQLYMLTRVT